MNDRVERVRVSMVKYFGADRKRIEHAFRVAGFAERILEKEPGNPETVLVTALLHDIGIKEAERKYGSAAGHLQEQEGPPVARDILERLGYSESFVAEVCGIIASHHSPGEIYTANFRVIWDADWLVNLEEVAALGDRAKLATMIEKIFLSRTGTALAREIYLDQP
jgi:hypothetical protein